MIILRIRCETVLYSSLSIYLKYDMVYVVCKPMADLHDDITYEGWGKRSAAGHRECMGNSKRVLRRSISVLRGKTDRLHALIFATQRVGVFISESDGCIAVR